jgi:predicted nucleotidyltransferase
MPLPDATLPHPTPPDATLPNATLRNATLAEPMLPRTPLPDWVGAIPAEIAYPTVFVTISGAHLYGFASVDSDVDLRGVHILPLPEVVGLRHGPQTLKRGGVRDGVELDLVTHDLAMFLGLLLKPNGYVLEQLLSPLVVQTSGLHAELVALAPGCLTRHHSHHYRGFANGQWKLFESTGELKPALYTLRVLLTGIHLMRTGEVVADLRQLYGKHQLPYVSELIEAKTTGEHRLWTDMASRRDRALLARDVARLHATLAQAAEQTDLPPRPSTYDALHDLLLRTRLS